MLSFVSVYMFVIEAFSVAFKLTGLSTKKIKFQVASLFTGSGFTTNESEVIVNDARRRKIAIVCMYTGHVFSVVIMGLLINVLISISASIASSNTNTLDVKQWYFIVFCVSLGIFLIVLLLKIPFINKRFQNFLEKIAIKMSRANRKTNIVTVSDVYGKNAIAEVVLNKIPDFAVDVPLFKMELTKKYSINVLSIKRGTRSVEVSKDTMFKKGDILVIFGLASNIKEAFVKSIDGKQDAIVLDKTNELNLLNNYGPNVLMEVNVEEVPKELDGIAMKDSHLPDRYNINIVIIKRNDEYIFVNKDLIIQQGDVITLLGPIQNIKHLFKNDDK